MVVAAHASSWKAPGCRLPTRETYWRRFGAKPRWGLEHRLQGGVPGFPVRTGWEAVQTGLRKGRASARPEPVQRECPRPRINIGSRTRHLADQPFPVVVHHRSLCGSLTGRPG